MYMQLKMLVANCLVKIEASANQQAATVPWPKLHVQARQVKCGSCTRAVVIALAVYWPGL